MGSAPDCSGTVRMNSIAHPREPNHFRPVALTSHLMKSMERIVLNYLRCLVGSELDPLQFAYRPGVDFQYDTDSCHLQKFSDDTAIVGCVKKGNDLEYKGVITSFVEWCGKNHLQINTSKTKEMVIDFSPTTATTSSQFPPVSTRSLETLSSPQLQMAHGQLTFASKKSEGVTYRPKSASEGFRRHSTDGTGIAPVPGEERRFHPYCRQYSEGSPPLCSSPFACVKEETPQTSNQLSTFPDEFTSGEQINYSYDPYNRISSNTNQPETAEMLYPKPIYSYSILIFMALRSSQTGSLPVSEIYSFMTEHFPYFKTAPDGWKNSVRHNLSLNKCFEKVDNKSGHASRKGCLWALNPAKVGKMQEELQKWRRKDPLTIRKSMARPDELDHLLEDRADKIKSSSVRLNHRQTYPALRKQGYDTVSPHVLTQPREHDPHSHRQPLYSYSSPAASQRPPYLPHNPTVFPFQCIITQQPGTILPSNIGALESPLPAQTPPSYSAALQANNGVSQSMQELLLEGDQSTDIDMLNPSLTDLQLHGYLWEELKDDSLAPDTVTTTPVTLSSFQASPGWQRVVTLQGLGSTRADASGPGAGEGDPKGMLELSITAQNSTTFPNMDSMSTY
ncbi:forkhead box protein N1 [Alosa alosa]|uniref:forkhead box protein N1 n=1 Tax=Alosa alosa TaxID=278164 RepID=UPI00201524B6|nr:forkhead box protein N1 [Alosa alosa]